MYSGYSGQRRGLLRPATGDGPIFRNFLLLGFLMGLLFLFLIFNMYQAQSSELSDMRSQIELERSRYVKVKSENIDFKAQLEKYRSSEASLKNELQVARLSQKKCSEKMAKWNITMLSCMTNLKQLQDDKNTCFTELDLMEAELTLAKLALTNLQANSTSVGSVMESSKETAASFKKQLEGKRAQQTVSRTILTASPLAITQGGSELGNCKNASIQSKKLDNKIEHSLSLNSTALNLFQQAAVLPQPVAVTVPECIVTVTKSSDHLHASTILSISRNAARDDQLHFPALRLQFDDQSLKAKNKTNQKLPNSEVQLNFNNILGMNEQVFIGKDKMRKI
ncbi:unnamed protein product [Litomosoides sigmodontis]|uniref:Uncharacterized protein n=1 Tax=Litomosoides sigmodontis TaxID=42156 RepID=A0A3P6SM32_LITSI|nr:unnamed protein product [Litomosoides sigmodontis]